MNQPQTPGHQNGKYEAPHFLNGAPASTTRTPTEPSAQRTVFPPDPHHADWRRPAYILDQFLFFGAPLRRFVVFLLIVLAALAGLGALPGRWFTAGFLIFAIIGFVWYLRSRRTHNFVHFAPESPPDPVPDRLPPNDKIPIYVTGLLSVEGKYKRFTHVPGFYRTFATGEHALLCLIRDRTIFKAGHWPEEDIGMWYVFFTPDLIQSVKWGTLAFGPDKHPALAVHYRLTIPPGEQNRREQTVDETIYIATTTPDDTTRLLADLLWELPPTAQPRRPASVHAA